MDVLIPKICTNKRPKERLLEKFASGILTNETDNVTVIEQDTMPDIDQLLCHNVGVYYGAYKSSDSYNNERQQVKQAMHHFFPKCVVIETPLIDRQKHNVEFRIGINGHLRQQATWPWDRIDPERVDEFYKKRSFDYQRGWKSKRGDKILLTMQTNGDASLHGIDIYDWTMDTVEQLVKQTDRKIVVRANPNHLKRETDNILSFGERVQQLPNTTFVYPEKTNTRPLQKDLDNAWCLVCHSSGASIDAVIAGIPVICLGEECMAYPVCDHSIDVIENPTMPDTLQWFHSMAMIQYHENELESGECWSYVRSYCS